MKWYHDLFLGRLASERAEEIIRDAADEQFDRELRLITLAPNGIDQLNIVCPKRVIGKRSALAHMEMVVGIALGHTEALDVIAAIARTTLEERGDCDMRSYFAERCEAEEFR